MWHKQLLFGLFFLLISAFLRAWGKIHLRHPLYERPPAFQSQRFISLLFMISNAFFVLGLLTIFSVRFWAGLVALLIYPFLFLPAVSFILTKILP